MRTLILCVLLSACAARATAWTTLDPPDLPDGGEAFVVVGTSALHLANVEHTDDRIRGRVIHAWQLPPAGVAAVADASMSPEAIARRAGWTELHLAAPWVDIPLFAIRSARGAVEPEPDEPSPNDNPSPLLLVVATSLIDAVLEPRCCCHGH